MLTITPREAPSLVVGRVTVYHHAQTRQKLIHKTQQCHPTAPGPPQYHTTLVYHHDKETPIHLLIAGHTTRAYNHVPESPSPTQVFQVVVVRSVYRCNLATSITNKFV